MQYFIQKSRYCFGSPCTITIYIPLPIGGIGEIIEIHGMHSCTIYKGGGTGEALKLKLHLNSEVYKRGNFRDFGDKKGEQFRASPKNILFRPP